jgi:hypothetical protein
MLEIICVRTDEQGWAESSQPLDLFPDTELNIVWENPLFLHDQISVVFSLSFPVPSSPNNLKLFNFPNRLTSVFAKRKVNATIRHSGVMIARGELLLVEAIDELSLQFKGAVENIDQKHPLNDLDLGEKDFNVGYPSSIELLDYTQASWDEYRQAAQNRAIGNSPDPYCHAPVKKEGSDWSGPHEAVGGLLNSVHQYVNYYNPNLGGFSLEDRFSLGQPTPDSHSPVMPFLPLHRIISSAMGDTLLNNPYAIGDFAKIVLISTAHPNYYLDFLYQSFVSQDNITDKLFPISESDSGNVVWQLKSFMQAYAFNEFFKNILKIFGQTLFRGTKSEIEFKDDTFKRDVVKSWENKLHNRPVIIREEGKDYRFSYTGETHNFDGELQEFDTWDEVYNAAIQPQSSMDQSLNEEELFYKVAGYPQIVGITKTLRTRQNEPWLRTRVVKTALNSEITRKREDIYEVLSDVKPLNMGIEQYWWMNHNLQLNSYAPNDVIYKRHWHVPVMPGQAKEDPPFIMMFAGMKDAFPPLNQYPYFGGQDKYPYLTNHHTDHFGSRTFDFSLIPDGPDGITQKFHSSMKEWAEKDKLKLRGLFNLDIHDLHHLDMRDKIHVRGKLFFIERINFSLTQKGISKSDVSLIEV